MPTEAESSLAARSTGSAPDPESPIAEMPDYPNGRGGMQAVATAYPTPEASSALSATPEPYAPIGPRPEAGPIPVG
jgi:hypothetical protein